MTMGYGIIQAGTSSVASILCQFETAYQVTGYLVGFATVDSYRIRLNVNRLQYLRQILKRV